MELAFTVMLNSFESVFGKIGDLAYVVNAIDVSWSCKGIAKGFNGNSTQVKRKRVTPGIRMVGRGNGKQYCLNFLGIAYRFAKYILFIFYPILNKALYILELELGEQLVSAGNQQVHVTDLG